MSYGGEAVVGLLKRIILDRTSAFDVNGAIDCCRAPITTELAGMALRSVCTQGLGMPQSAGIFIFVR